MRQALSEGLCPADLDVSWDAALPPGAVVSGRRERDLLTTGCSRAARLFPSVIKQTWLSFSLNGLQTQVAGVGTCLLAIQTAPPLGPWPDRLVPIMSLEESGATKLIDFTCPVTWGRGEDLGDAQVRDV